MLSSGMKLGSRLTALGLALTMFTWAATSTAEGASLDDASKEQSLAAQKTFEAANVLYDAKHYAEALTAFRASHDVVKSPNTRLMIARCLRELGRLGEAYAETAATIAEAEAASERHPRYAETTRAAQNDLKTLATRVGFVKIELPGAATGESTAKIGERSFDATAMNDPIAVTPGDMTVVVNTPGRSEYRRDIVVEAGSTQTLTIDSKPPRSMDSAEPEPKPPVAPPKPIQSAVRVGPQSSMRTWAYVAGGVGAAGLVTFGVFGLMHNSNYSALEDDCPNGRCPPGRNDDIESGRRYQLIANVGLGVGIVGIGAGATLFVLSAKKPTGEQARTAVRFTPSAVSVEGRF
jgi:hypothetical protein